MDCAPNTDGQLCYVAQMDLLSEAIVHDVRSRLRSINSEASVIPTTRCQIDLGRILNLAAYESSGPTQSLDAHNHNCADHGCIDVTPSGCGSHHGLSHNPLVGTISLTYEEQLDQER